VTNSKGNLLAIDTSGAYAFCAVHSSDGRILERRSAGAVSHNEELSGMIKQSLKAAFLKPIELEGIVIGSGPGSFTGLRIGFSVAKGISFALKIPLMTIGSHWAIAQGCNDEGRPSERSVAVVSDARRDEAFLSVYHCKGGSPAVELLEPSIVPIAELEVRAAEVAPSGVVWVGELSVSGLQVEPPKNVGMGLVSLVKDSEFQGFSIDSLSQIEPRYLRAVAAKTIAERAG
jgi:tRNA threonylcarbamoyl adenosine modification protein YeaZ